MKNKFRFFEFLMLCSFAFVATSCDDDDPPQGGSEPPTEFTLTTEVSNVKATGADIKIIPSDDDTPYFHAVLPAEGLKDLSDEDLLTRLGKEDLTATRGIYTITAEEMDQTSPLDPETEYLLCAYHDKLLKKELFTTAAPHYDVVIDSKFCDMSYWADFHKVGMDNYTLYMGTADHEGLYIKGEGEFVMFSLTGPHLENYMDAKVLPGTFVFNPDPTFKEMTLVGMECSRIVYGPEKDQNGYFIETKYQFTGGTLKIEEVNGAYKVRFTGVLDNNETICINYDGNVSFMNNYASLIPAQIDANKEFTCGYGEAAAQEGNVYSMDLMAGEDPAQGGGWTLRDRMQVILRAEGDGTAIPDGMYPIEAGAKLNAAEPGDFALEGNSSYVFGSYYYFVNEEFDSTYGFFKSGNVTVKREGEIYHIKVDAVDANGFTVKASYDGKLKLYNDRENAARAFLGMDRLNPRCK